MELYKHENNWNVKWYTKYYLLITIWFLDSYKSKNKISITECKNFKESNLIQHSDSEVSSRLGYL